MPSSLHQFLIQWIGDEVEVVHGDTSSFIGAADSELIGAHDHIKYLSGLDLTDYDLISCTKEGFFICNLKADGESATFTSMMQQGVKTEPTGQTASSDRPDRPRPTGQTGASDRSDQSSAD